MAWEWLVWFDAVLGLGVLGAGVYVVLRGPRTFAAWLYSAAAFMATFRIFYFILPKLFGTTWSPGFVGVFPATENILGIALVGMALALCRPFLSDADRMGLYAIFGLGLGAMLLLFQSDPNTGLLPFIAPTFLATIFVASTAVVAHKWLLLPDLRDDLVFVVGPLYAWSLNDAVRVGHSAFLTPEPSRTAATWYVLALSLVWFLGLIVIGVRLIRPMPKGGVVATERHLLVIMAIGGFFTLLQTLPQDADGMRAIHLVLDCAAIILIGYGVARIRSDKLELRPARKLAAEA